MHATRHTGVEATVHILGDSFPHLTSNTCMYALPREVTMRKKEEIAKPERQNPMAYLP